MGVRTKKNPLNIPWTVLLLVILVIKHVPLMVKGEKTMMGNNALWFHFLFIPIWAVLIIGGSWLINKMKRK